MRILILAILITAASAAEPDPSFPDRYYVVEAVHTYATNGTSVQGEVVKRYVLKGLRRERIGEIDYLIGRTPSDDNVLIDGSNWSSILIPAHHVRVLAGVNDVKALLQRNAPNAGLGVVVK